MFAELYSNDNVYWTANLQFLVEIFWDCIDLFISKQFSSRVVFIVTDIYLAFVWYIELVNYFFKSARYKTQHSTSDSYANKSNKIYNALMQRKPEKYALKAPLIKLFIYENYTDLFGVTDICLWYLN